MRIQNFMMFLLFILGTTSYASAACPQTIAEAFTYSDIMSCRACYATPALSGGSNDLVAADRYCLAKMSPYTSVTEICAQKQVALQDPPLMTQAEVANFKLQVVQVGKPCAPAIASTTVTTAVVAAAPTATTTGVDAQKAEYDAYVKAQAAAAAARTAAAAGGAAAGTAGSGSSAGGIDGQTMLGLAKIFSDSGKGDKSGSSGSGTSGSGSNSNGGVALNHEAPATPGAPVAPTSGSNTAQVPQAAPGVVQADPAAPGVVQADPATPPPATPGELGAATTQVSKLNPTLAKPAQDAQHAATTEAPIPPNSITEKNAVKANVKLEELNAKIQAKGTQIGSGVCFQALATKFFTFATSLNKYVQAKKTCSSLASKAEFLCVEGTSPGAKAAHTLIDVAGPVLAVMSSAQKSCSSTSKVMNLASMTLLAAKAVCVAAKVACDTSCASSAKDLTALQADAEANQAAYNTELSKCQTLAAQDPLLNPVAQQAVRETASKPPVAQTQLVDIKETLAQEATPAEPGTTPNLVAQCKSKLKDIAGMGINILGMLAAKSSADKCAEQLASSSGAASGDITTAQYCENAANVTTQFCKCQANSNQEGCPGYVAGAIGGDASGNDVAGTSIHEGSGVSAFASGAGKGAAPVVPNSGLSNLGSSGGDLGASSLGAGSGSGSNSGLGNVGSSGSSGFDSKGSAEAAAKAAEAKKADEAKKWDFGAAASAFFGSGPKASKNGDVNGPDKANAVAIERKIASDRLASEVTSASGKSNWEKIRRSYLTKENTFLSGQ
jgi:hypothetical protein